MTPLKALPPLRVLVTQGSMKHSVGLIRHLSIKGHMVFAAVEPDDPRPHVRHSRYCAGVVRLPQGEEKPFIDALVTLLEKEPFDVLVPMGFPVTRFVARNLERLRPLVGVAAPGPALELLAGDKFAISERARMLNVGTPSTILLDSTKDLRAQIDGVVRLPVIVKGRGESPKGIVVRVDEWGDERERLDARLRHVAPGILRVPLVAQEYVPGWGCGFFATYDRGRCRRVFMHRRIREWPPSGGASSCAQSFRDSKLAAAGRRLFDGLQWHGIAMAEFRFDERDEQFKLIEVNAKFWGSLELALAAGADFGEDYLRLALGEPLEFHDDYSDVTFQWFLGGDLRHAIQRPRQAFAVAATLFRKGVLTDLSPDDPSLLAARVYSFARRSIRGALRRTSWNRE